MNTWSKIVLAAVTAGFLTSTTLKANPEATPEAADDTTKAEGKKDGCGGKDGCSGKKHKKEKGHCNSKDHCKGKDKKNKAKH